MISQPNFRCHSELMVCSNPTSIHTLFMTILINKRGRVQMRDRRGILKWMTEPEALLLQAVIQREGLVASA